LEPTSRDATGMIRSFFFVLGVVFAALIMFCGSFFGRIALEIDGEGPANEELAVKITRELSHSWSVRDIKPYYAKSIAAHPNSRPGARASQWSLEAKMAPCGFGTFRSKTSTGAGRRPLPIPTPRSLTPD